jgi:hypothetical protein
VLLGAFFRRGAALPFLIEAAEILPASINR